MSEKTQLSTIQKNVVDNAEARVQELLAAGNLNLPESYSVGNAMRTASLILQETVNAKKEPVLQACTQTSIANALLSMAIQGLNPAKNQVYFIAYGDKLVAQRSYFGDIALAKRFCGVKSVHAQVVYAGDKFETEIDYRGVEHVSKHVRSDEGREDIVAVYAVVLFEDEDREFETTVMTWPEVLKSWSMAPTATNPARSKFPGEMAKRTVIRRALKGLLNSSDDEALGFIEAITNAQVIEARQQSTTSEAQHVIEEGEYFDVETGEVFDEEPVEAAFEPTQPAPAPAPVVVTEEERAGF